MIAEKLGMTVFKLLTGRDAPLGGSEYNYWLCYFKIKAQEEADQQRAANKAANKASKQQAAPARNTLGG